jgi:hypothetical protein
MTTGGWLTMIFSVGSVTVLFIYCVWRVLCGKHPDHELGHIEPVHKDQVKDD